MSYIKTQEYSKAENDCNEVLKLNPKHSKALYRRGLARKKMKNYKNSLEDFKQAFALDPENKDIEAEVKFLEKI
jgi:peptidyl-prolyl isomerase D